MKRFSLFLVLTAALLIFFSPSSIYAMMHPAQGRFLQRDPAGYVDGMGVYEWERGNPFVYLDPRGTRPRGLAVLLRNGAKEELKEETVNRIKPGDHAAITIENLYSLLSAIYAAENRGGFLRHSKNPMDGLCKERKGKAWQYAGVHVHITEAKFDKKWGLHNPTVTVVAEYWTGERWEQVRSEATLHFAHIELRGYLMIKCECSAKHDGKLVDPVYLKVTLNEDISEGDHQPAFQDEYDKAIAGAETKLKQIGQDNNKATNILLMRERGEAISVPRKAFQEYLSDDRTEFDTWEH